MIKTCTICGKEFEGVTSAKTCSAVCQIVHRRRWRKQYRQLPRVLVYDRRYNRKYYSKHRINQEYVEKRREYGRMYYHENRGKISEYMQKYMKGYRARLCE